MRRFVLLSCFIFAVLSTWASGAYRLPIVVTQSDGTSLTILGHGNKDFNWITTSDGAIIVRQGNGFYIASVDEEGNIIYPNGRKQTPEDIKQIERFTHISIKDSLLKYQQKYQQQQK